MKNLLFISLCFTPLLAQKDLVTVYEQSQGLETATYDQGIAFYKSLAKRASNVSIQAMGMTDSGKPLHLVLFSANGTFEIAKLKKQGKRFWMINNAIHAGEPDGVDASMMFLRDLAMGKTKRPGLENVVIGIIPFYNIGGVLNRNSTTRVNQDGPKAYGFRGNARNYDLNRDFIKNDSLNSHAFAEIFHLLNPDVYLETHVTNGSDHQYVLTLLTTQASKMGGPLGRFLNDKFEPSIMDRLEKSGVAGTPYVNVFGSTPDKGFNQFLDGPRYSTGYTTLFHTLGFMTETHSLKPFKQRVLATRSLMEALLDTTIEMSENIAKLRADQQQYFRDLQTFPLAWQVDKSQSTTLRFQGYEPEMRPSLAASGERLFYNREKPFQRDVPFFNTFKPALSVRKPQAYIVPRGWHNVVTLLKRNKIEMREITEQKQQKVMVYRISDYKTSTRPYEGHYPHYQTKLTKSEETVNLTKGDWWVPTDQPGVRYILQILEPQAPDSLFSWNYFDTILQQKEYFSSYIFEEIAQKLLQSDPALKAAYEQEKAKNKEFADNQRAQLDWIYRRSPHYEKAHLRYPILRVP